MDVCFSIHSFQIGSGEPTQALMFAQPVFHLRGQPFSDAHSTQCDDCSVTCVLKGVREGWRVWNQAL